jgi:hypothetical protein
VRIFRCIKRSFDWSSCSCRFRFKCSLCYIKTALRSIWVGWGSFSCSGYCSPDLSRCNRSKTNCCRSSRRWWSSGWCCSRSYHELALLHDHLGCAVYSNQHISFTAQRLVSIAHFFDCSFYCGLKISAQCSAFYLITVQWNLRLILSSVLLEYSQTRLTAAWGEGSGSASGSRRSRSSGCSRLRSSRGWTRLVHNCLYSRKYS